MTRKRKHVYVCDDACFVYLGEGGWRKTDRCVAFVDCPYPGCGAKAGQRCQNDGKETNGTH